MAHWLIAEQVWTDARPVPLEEFVAAIPPFAGNAPPFTDYSETRTSAACNLRAWRQIKSIAQNRPRRIHNAAIQQTHQFPPQRFRGLAACLLILLGVAFELGMLGFGPYNSSDVWLFSVIGKNVWIALT